MSNEPEGVQDLLEQDAGMSEADAEEEQEMNTSKVVAAAQKPNGAARTVTAVQGGKQQQNKAMQAAGPMRNGRLPPRFFILKSKSMFNVDQSVEKGIWATQKHNEEKLNEAFRQKCGVFLIFSVNMSGHFQGYARMQSYVSRDQNTALWEDSAAVGGTFRVDWKRRFDLPFSATNHLYNPLNEGKPVRIGRDGQELPADVGRALCQLHDEGADAAGIPPPSRPAGAVGGPGRGRGGGPFPGRFGGPRPPMGPFGMQGGPMGDPMMHMGPMNPMMGMGFPMGAGRPPFMGPNGMEPFGGGGFQGPAFGGGFGGGFGAVGGMARGRPDQAAPFAGAVAPRGPQPLPAEELAPVRRTAAIMGRPAVAGGRGQTLGGRGRGVAPMEDDYEDADWDRGYSRKRDRHEPPLDRHSRRRRSRSPSPRRERSRRRSRSRSRSRSRDRKGLVDMSYEQYLEAFEKLQQKARGGGAAATAVNPMMMGVNPMMVMAQAMMSQGMGGMGGVGGGPSMAPRGMMGMGGGAPSMGGLPNGVGGGGSGGAQISEDEYVRVWKNYSEMMGTPFNPEVVRGWYQQYRQTLGR